MIKIPENKYIGLEKTHYNNIKEYLEDTIKFYINCCDIVSDPTKVSEYSCGITTYKHIETLFSLIKVISEGFVRPSNKNDSKNTLIIKTIPEVFTKKLIKKEFEDNCSKYKLILQDMLTSTKEVYIEKIITSKPDELVQIYNFICSSYTNITNSKSEAIFSSLGVKKGLFYDILKNIFNYEKFSSKGMKTINNKFKWNAYNLCSKLNVNVCPYCNRMYTFTVSKASNKKTLTRPELDHFMPQSKYPFFALSFYNLIPSCKICNSSFKRDDYLPINSFLHPYLNGLHENYKFDYEPIDINGFNSDKQKVYANINKNGFVDLKSDNSLDKFEIEEIYKKHNDVVADLIYKRRIYSDAKINEIVSILNSGSVIAVTSEEIFNSIFNVPETEKVIDVSLGKLRKDITQKLKSIK